MFETDRKLARVFAPESARGSSQNHAMLDRHQVQP